MTCSWHRAVLAQGAPAELLAQRLIHELIPRADARLHPGQRGLKVMHLYAWRCWTFTTCRFLFPQGLLQQHELSSTWRCSNIRMKELGFWRSDAWLHPRQRGLIKWCICMQMSAGLSVRLPRLFLRGSCKAMRYHLPGNNESLYQLIETQRSGARLQLLQRGLKKVMRLHARCCWVVNRCRLVSPEGLLQEHDLPSIRQT